MQKRPIIPNVPAETPSSSGQPRFNVPAHAGCTCGDPQNRVLVAKCKNLNGADNRALLALHHTASPQTDSSALRLRSRLARREFRIATEIPTAVCACGCKPTIAFEVPFLCEKLGARGSCSPVWIDRRCHRYRCPSLIFYPGLRYALTTDQRSAAASAFLNHELRQCGAFAYHPMAGVSKTLVNAHKDNADKPRYAPHPPRSCS